MACCRYVQGGDNGVKVNRLNPVLTGDHANTPLNVEDLSIRYQNLTEAVNLVKWPASLRSLDLTGNKIRTMNSSFSLPPKLRSLSVSTNEMTVFDNVMLPESLESINFDVNQFDVFNVNNASFAVLKTAKVLTDRIIRHTGTCNGVKDTFLGTPFTPVKGGTPSAALTHTACVVLSSVVPTGEPGGPTSKAPVVHGDVTQPPATMEESSSLGLIVDLSAAAVVVVGVVLFVVLRRRRSRRNGNFSHHHAKAVTAITSDALPDHAIAADYHNHHTHGASSHLSSHVSNGSSFQDQSTFGYVYDIRGDADLINYRIPKRELQNKTICGSGGFATVYRATFHDQVVAVKELTANMHGHAQHRHIQAFMNEIKLFATLNHNNIVRFVGVSWTTLNDLAVVSEFMSEGDLRDLLVRDAVPQHLHWFESSSMGFPSSVSKLSLAINIADAITYLHSFSPAILHRDLKSRNVLLSEAFVAKLTDFGISREASDETMTVEAGTAAWTAPEVLTNSGHYDEKADIYSLGVVLSELDTWQIPYSSGTSGSGYSNVQMAMLVAAGKLAPSFRTDCPPEVLQLARACLEMDPENRPKASKVAYELRRLHSTYLRQKGKH
ncbi:TKL protein kinase, variant 1 [Aphanomyces invadans]|uniref:TKL protein kinase, variant 1 n=1 Tax=Aphanomyces invadans TaxID=157072 RepID=A0A024TY77_9STRA|nr:TKL protein kinase, variant 1 [Aphanomyces invadans]ETV98596.1 TKL protein kinase, variant 1 [Aphanomyces invadans]|eukprot:XP_008872793.1 TKL protein kinase, variant 1 [Aphanomyces invadans]